MIRTPDQSASFIRYFPVFMATIFLNIFSGSVLVPLVGMTYFKGVEGAIKMDYSLKAMFLLAGALVLGNFLIARGRRGGVWLVAGLFIACLLTALPTFQYSPDRMLIVLALLFPLLGLLLLNSRRHREMRKRMEDMRQLRIEMGRARRGK